MGLSATDKGGVEFEPMAPGGYIGVCDMVVDLGVQDGGKYPDRQQCYIRWNMPAARVTWAEDGEEKEGPAVNGRFFTVSLSSTANLRKFLKGWRGRDFTTKELEDFDLFNLLGAPCQLNIIHKEREGKKPRADIQTCMPLIEGMEKPESEIPPIGYSREESFVSGEPRPSSEVYDMLPEWLQKKIDEQIILDAEASSEESTESAASDEGESEGPKGNEPF